MADLPTRSPAEQHLYDKTLSCVHCGLCLPACPTYEAKPRESLAPRGQVYNVRALLEGRLELTPTLSEDLYQCLGCRGCETVCPAGVPVGSIVEDVRSLITEQRVESATTRLLKRFLLAGVVARPGRLSVLMAVLRVYQRSGLRRVVQFMLGALLPSLAERERLMPSIAQRTRWGSLLQPIGPVRGRVAFFTGCVASYMVSDTNRATIDVLLENGFEVLVPPEQRCCGALHIHNGLLPTARRLAQENIDAFAGLDVEAVIVNAAGCGAALAEYGELLKDAPAAPSFTERVTDISAFLVRRGFRAPTVAPLDEGLRRVVYDAPCHLFHAQKVKHEPLELLKSIPGVELQETTSPERCCGSAGIYNITHHEMAMRVLDAKMRDIAPHQPNVIVTGNPGCHIQLGEGARRSGLSAEVLHPVVLLDRAYRAERQGSTSD